MGEEVIAILAVGIDLAKNVFAQHGVNAAGKPELLLPRLPRARLNEAVAALPPAHDRHRSVLRAHDWARRFQARGHTVRLMVPRLVTHCRVSGRRGRNGAADAAAICEAMQRPDMRL